MPMCAALLPDKEVLRQGRALQSQKVRLGRAVDRPVPRDGSGGRREGLSLSAV